MKADTRVKTVGLSGPAHGTFAQLHTPYIFQFFSDRSTQARGPPESPVHVPRPPLMLPAQIMLSVRMLAYHDGWLHVERLNRVSSTSCNVRVAFPPSETLSRTVLLQFASHFNLPNSPSQCHCCRSLIKPSVSMQQGTQNIGDMHIHNTMHEHSLICQSLFNILIF